MPHGHHHHHGGGGRGWGGGYAMPYPYYYPYPYWIDPLGIDPVVTLEAEVPEEPVAEVSLREINSDEPVIAPWGYPYSQPKAMDPTVGVDTFAMDPANWLQDWRPTQQAAPLVAMDGMGSAGWKDYIVEDYPDGYPVGDDLMPDGKTLTGLRGGTWVKNEADEYEFLSDGMSGMGCGKDCACGPCKKENGMGAIDIQSKFTTPIIITMAIMLGLCYFGKKK